MSTQPLSVMPSLVPRIHVSFAYDMDGHCFLKTWIAGTSPAMTTC